MINIKDIINDNITYLVPKDKWYCIPQALYEYVEKILPSPLMQDTKLIDNGLLHLLLRKEITKVENKRVIHVDYSTDEYIGLIYFE